MSERTAKDIGSSSNFASQMFYYTGNKRANNNGSTSRSWGNYDATKKTETASAINIAYKTKNQRQCCGTIQILVRIY